MAEGGRLTLARRGEVQARRRRSRLCRELQSELSGFLDCHDLQVVERKSAKLEWALAPNQGKVIMPYVRIWVHLIWSTKNRTAILVDGLRQRVFTHIKENAPRKDIFLDAIDGTTDHVHCLVSLGSDQTIAKVAQLLKGESSHWVNQTNLSKAKFEWQDEYIAVSVSESMVDTVREYIRNQQEHHRKKTFKEEYDEFMTIYGFEILKKG